MYRWLKCIMEAYILLPPPPPKKKQFSQPFIDFWRNRPSTSVMVYCVQFAHVLVVVCSNTCQKPLFVLPSFCGTACEPAMHNVEHIRATIFSATEMIIFRSEVESLFRTHQDCLSVGNNSASDCTSSFMFLWSDLHLCKICLYKCVILQHSIQMLSKCHPQGVR
jgi:hypothetical protein